MDSRFYPPVLKPKNNTMKILKNLSFSIMLIAFSAFSYIHEPAVVTLVSSKKINEASELVVDFDGEIITDTWHKDNLVRVEMEIKVKNEVSYEVVKLLVRKGRYRINTLEQTDGSLLFFIPNLKDSVFVNGERLTEDISYRLLVPKNVLVRIKSWGE
jgi:hypothetical protein